MASNQHMAFIGEHAAVAVGIAHRQIGQPRIAFQREGAVVTHRAAFRIRVNARHPGFERHDVFVFRPLIHRLAIQNTARAHQIVPTLRHIQCHKRIGRVQHQLFAVELGGANQPFAVLLEHFQAFFHVFFIFHRKVGHDADDVQIRQFDHRHRILFRSRHA